ncbi:NDUFA4 family protein [Neobacillus mesonae]|nr:NDUFA4 family protein [Neobacillus mesonae]MCM3569179.1 NDUFA4 family protein [Neobacillus mesonae]
MALWWITLIGLVVCLGIAGGVIFYYLRQALNSEDAERIDKIGSNEPKKS